MGRTSAEWLELAKKRIRKILRVRKICSHAQLEAKIAEAGPPQDRPQSGVVRKARKEMLREGEIRKIYMPELHVPFYVFSSFTVDGEKERYQRVKKAYKSYVRVSAKYALCGKVAETVVYRAMVLADSLNVWGSEDEKTSYINGRCVLDGNHPLDFIVSHKKTGIPLGVEVKNKRRWYHRRDWGLWEALAKCVSVKVLPVFICRKFEYTLYVNVFSIIGCFGYKLHNQYFHCSVEEELSDVRHKDGLGFADVRFPIGLEGTFDPEPRHIVHFRETIPKHIGEFWSRYEKCLPILHEYLIKDELWKTQDEGLLDELLKEISFLR